MKCISLLKNFCQDIKYKICANKLKMLLCGIISLVGVVLGFVLLHVFSYTWWYSNRCTYAEKIYGGGFSLVFDFLLGYAIFYLATVICNLSPKARFLVFVVLLVGCLYCGANAAAVISIWTVWGVMYAAFAMAVQLAGFCLCSFAICCMPSACQSFGEIIRDTKSALLIIVASFIVKILGFFVILKILTAVI